MLDLDFDKSCAYTHSRMTGVAWQLLEWEDRDNDIVLACMVGDDKVHHLHSVDFQAIEDDDYCGGCGQIGCGWH